MWTNYRVTLQFIKNLCASVPENPDLLSIVLGARKPRVIPAQAKTIAEIQEEVMETLRTEAEQTAEPFARLIFQRVNGGLVVRAATVRAHIKDCARVLSAQYVGKIKGERSFATRVLNGVYNDEQEYWLPILDAATGKQIAEPSGVYQHPVHVRGPRGEPLNSIKVFEFVIGAKLEVTLKILGTSVSLEDLNLILSYGGVHGYGGERGNGEGKYTFRIEEGKNADETAHH